LKFIDFEIPYQPSIEEIETFLRAEEEPNSIPEPTLFLCQKAKEMGIKVLYNALGPDEIFGGYPYFVKTLKINKFRILLKHFPTFLLPERYKLKIHELNTYGPEIYPFVSRQLFSWSEIRNFLEKHNYRLPEEHPLAFIKNQIREIYPDFEKIPLLKKISYCDIFYYVGSHHSFRSDQPSMKYGVEMRFPFLEHTFVEKYFNQTNAFSGLKKSLKPQFRNYARHFLAEPVLTMEKSGFTMPLKNWIPGSSKNSDSKTWYKLGLKEIFSEFSLD